MGRFVLISYTARIIQDLAAHMSRPHQPDTLPLTSRLNRAGKDVGVTGIQDGHGGATEQLTTCGTKLDLQS